MRREELQAIQGPLKRRYRDDGTSAVVTLRAEADLDVTEVSCSVQTGRALVEAGLHPASEDHQAHRGARCDGRRLASARLGHG